MTRTYQVFSRLTVVLFVCSSFSYDQTKSSLMERLGNRSEHVFGITELSCWASLNSNCRLHTRSTSSPAGRWVRDLSVRRNLGTPVS